MVRCLIPVSNGIKVDTVIIVTEAEDQWVHTQTDLLHVATITMRRLRHRRKRLVASKTGASTN